MTVRPEGRIIDKGDKVIAERMSNEQAARHVVQFALLKNWRRVEFFGNDDFIRLAMTEALKNGLDVHPRDSAQAAIWEQVKAAHQGVAGAATALNSDKAVVMRQQNSSAPVIPPPLLFGSDIQAKLDARRNREREWQGHRPTNGRGPKGP